MIIVFKTRPTTRTRLTKNWSPIWFFKLKNLEFIFPVTKDGAIVGRGGQCLTSPPSPPIFF